MTSIGYGRYRLTKFRKESSCRDSLHKQPKKLNLQKNLICLYGVRCILLHPFTPSYPPSTMAKGKNHDRKANPGFGKVKSKSGSSASKPEFNMKRVKGESTSWMA